MTSIEDPPPAPAEPAEVPDRVAPPSPATPARIAEQVASLDTVDELPLAEHVEVYRALHLELQAALAEIDGP